MDFAPYQDTSPEHERALSPPPARTGGGGGLRSPSFSPRVQSPALPTSQQEQAATGAAAAAAVQNPYTAAWTGAGAPTGFGNAGSNSNNDIEAAGLGIGRGGRFDEFATSLPIRLDYEACLAYLLLPPAGGLFLLVFERKSDYVRFHAWQSALVFSALFVLHLILLWSSFLSWLVFVADMGGVVYLTYRAYTDADTLDRFEVPFFGPIASRFVDEE